MRRTRAIDDAPMLFVCGMSRSGTTLLATVFDAHSAISMGSELIPGPGLRIDELRRSLERGLELADGSFTRCGPLVRKQGDREHGVVLTRCARAGLSAEQTGLALAALRDEGLTETADFPDRMRVAWRLMRERGRAEEATLFGFKLNSAALDIAHALFPGARFVSIIRDPRDVVVSHRKRKFDRSTEQICHAWTVYTKAAERMVAKHPELAVLTRYEALVSDPETELHRVFETLPVPIERAVFSFASSTSTIIDGHPNAEQLRRGFFSSSVGSWQRELTPGDVTEIERRCGRRMDVYASSPIADASD